jgi:hypothetical protein
MHHTWLSALALVLSCALFCVQASAQAIKAWVPDRRETPSKGESGFLTFPVFSHIPGIGSTYGAGFLGSNIGKSRVNVFSAALTGDTKALILGINEVHLIPNTLIFHFVGYNTRIPWEIHERGGESVKNNYFYLINGEYGGSLITDVELWKRRIQLTAKLGGSRTTPIGVTTKGGVGVNNLDSRESDAVTSNYSLMLDFTDDERDPRRGLNLQVTRDEAVVFDGLTSRFRTRALGPLAFFARPLTSRNETQRRSKTSAQEWGFSAGNILICLSESLVNRRKTFDCKSVTAKIKMVRPRCSVAPRNCEDFL